ncbi:MAG: hypothetical protein H6658_10930 [Ardenticatenaceae bacterium]|nr:hypothetical protein [Ardenticatenaceae bacterium]
MSDYPINPIQLSHIIAQRFDLEELRGLCFDYLAVNFEDLTGGLTNRAMQLVKLYERRRELRVLAEAILAERPSAITWADFAQEVATGEQTPGQPPYKGLDFFDEDDADQFFGREVLTADLLAHLQQNSFLAVIGASGSGKSSLVRAGLLPSLKGRKALAEGVRLPAQSPHWLYRVLTPTDRPLQALAQSLVTAVQPPASPQFTQEIQQRLADLRALLQQNQAAHVMPLVAQLEQTLSQAQRPTATVAELQQALAQDAQTLTRQIDALLLANNAPRLLLYVDQFEELFTQCKEEKARQAFVDNLLTAVHAHRPLTVLITLRADFYAQCAQHDGLRQMISQQQAYIGAMNLDELRQAIVRPAEFLGWQFDEGLVDMIVDDVEGEPGALPLLSHALLETWKRRQFATMTLAGYVSAGGIRGAIAETADKVLDSLTPAQQAITRRIFLRLTEIGDGTQDTRRRARLQELTQQASAAVNEVLEKLVAARLVIKAAETAEVAHEALIREWPTLRQWLDESREGLLLHRALSKATETWLATGQDAGMLYRGARLAQAQQWAQENGAELSADERLFLQTSQAVIDAEIREKEEAQRREAALLRLSLARQWAAQSGMELGRGRADLALLLAIEAGRKQAIPEAFTAVRQALADPRSTARQLIGDNGINYICTNQQKDQLLVCYMFNLVQLWDLPTGEVLFELHHGSHVRQARWSHDERKILTGSSDGTAKIWEAQTGAELLALPTGYDAQVVAWSPDDSQVLTVNVRGGEVHIWDAASGEQRHTLAHSDLVEGASWNATGTHILTASRDNTAVIWDAAAGERVQVFEHEEMVFTAVWNRDESRVLTASYDHTARVWDAATGAEMLKFSHDKGVNTAIWHERDEDSERLIATAGEDGLVKIYKQNEAYDWHALEHILRHDESVTALQWHEDGRSLLTTAGNKVQLWDMDSGHLRATWGHRQAVLGLAWGQGNRQLFTAGYDGLWQYEMDSYERPMLNFHEDIDRVLWNPQGDRVLLLASEWVGMWQPHTGELLWQREHGHYMQDAAWNGAGNQIALTSQSVNPAVWEADNGKVVHEFPGHEDVSLVPSTQIVWHSGCDLLAFVNTENVVVGWDAVTGEQRFAWPHEEPVAYLLWNEDGTQLLVVTEAGQAIVWEVTAVAPLHTIQLENYEELERGNGSIGWHVAQNRLTLKTGNWDLATGQVHEDVALLDEKHTLWHPQWNHNGDKLAASASGDWAICHDFVTHKTTYMQHQGMVQSCVFSRDESQLLTTAVDKTVRLWQVETGEEVLSWRFQNGVSWAGWSPDERHILVVEGQRLWQYWVRMEDLITAVCPRISRNMTVEEWARYMMGEPYRETCGESAKRKT